MSPKRAFSSKVFRRKPGALACVRVPVGSGCRRVATAREKQAGRDGRVPVCWSAIILVTNVSNVKIDCVATSYAANLPQGSEAVPAKDLKTDKLPNKLTWSRGKLQTSIDPRLLQRYGLGQVFELGPGEGRRLVLPIYVPKAHPDDFVEHFVFGSKRHSGT